LRLPFTKTEKRDALSFQQWVEFMSYGGVGYGISPSTTWEGAKQEAPSESFAGHIQGIYKANGVVFACMVARMLLFSEARFQFRQVRNGRPGELFGTGELQILETPWVNGTTGDLLSRVIQDADLAGNFYAYRTGNTITRMQPDWVSIVLGSNQIPDHPGWALDAKVVGYQYLPGGMKSGEDPINLLPEQVAHFAPIPDPAARFRGMSWLTPVIREVMGDNAATDHKISYFEHGATVPLAIKFDPAVQVSAFKEWVEAFKAEHQGVANAYKTLFLGGGADITAVGSDMKQVDFKVTQGAGETRIAMAARVPAVIAQISEGLQGSSLNEGNYQVAMRQFADLTMRPLWRNVAASFAPIVRVPGSAELWYDDRDIPALHESSRDAAEIQQLQSNTIHSLIAAGFDPDTVIDAVTAGEFNRLAHTGMFSVQLQPAGSVTEGKGSLVAGVPVATNGNTGGN